LLASATSLERRSTAVSRSTASRTTRLVEVPQSWRIKPAAADDDVGTFPGSLVRHERRFLGHPGLPCVYGRRVAWLADAGPAAPFSLPLIRLDPDLRVGEVDAFASCGTDAFDDEQRAARRYPDRALALMLVPPRRPEHRWLPRTRRNQDALIQQVSRGQLKLSTRSIHVRCIIGV
jgi:hypothetical protein